MAKDYDRIELPHAIRKWLQVIQPHRTKESKLLIDDMMAFGEFIGYPHDPYSKNNKVIDTTRQEVVDIIDLINSPNGRFIIKMMIARKTDDNEGTGN